MSSMAVTAALVLALAVGGAFAQSPSICTYDESGYSSNVAGYCGPNPDWIITQKGVAPLAKVYVAQQKWQATCSKYDVKSGAPAAIAKCLAGKANGCYLDGQPGAWLCVSNLNRAFIGVPCKGSMYDDYINCNGLYQSECTGACVWQPQLSSNYTRYLEFNKASGNSYDTAGYCFPSKYTSKFTKASQVDTFLASFGVDPSNPAEYARIRGTCQYAKDGARRFAYDNMCAKYNKDATVGLMYGTVSSSGGLTFTGMNYTAASGCLQAGCTLNYIPANVPWGYGADWFMCLAEPVQRYSLGYMGPQDSALLQAIRVCNDPAVRYNKALCLAGKL